MSWANCGTDSEGRSIGYGVAATCDEPGCSTVIDRGLGYACGGRHGKESGCEGYFCARHLVWSETALNAWNGRPGTFVCPACCAFDREEALA